MLRKILQLVIALVIITVGIFLMLRLIKTAPTAEKVPIERTPPRVEYVTAQSKNVVSQIVSQGEVTATKETTLSAELAGKITSVSPRFEIGGRFDEGEIILSLDETDYRASLAQAKSALSEAELALEVEQSRVIQAKRDWQKLGKGRPASALLLRVPQLKAAKARIEAAKSSLRLAQKNLERTQLRAPYPCQIESKLADLGTTVMPGTSVARLFSTAAPEIRLPLSLEDAPLITTEEKSQEEGGALSRFTVQSHYGSVSKEWTGSILRSENRVDPSSRTVYFVGQFDEGMSPPLGLFVEAEIEGQIIQNSIELPRVALRSQSEVFVISPEDTLEIRPVTVSRTTSNYVYIAEGLQSGERVCTTILSTPIAGMKLSPNNQ